MVQFELDLERLPLSGTGEAQYYTRNLRHACNKLMLLGLAIFGLSLVHDHLRTGYMDQALSLRYG